MPDPLDRLPPHSRDAERGVLGGVLRDPDVVPDVRLHADDFYFDSHRRVWQAVGELAARRSPVDLVTLHERLRARGDLADVGGAEALADLWEAVATGANVGHHAKIVRDCAKARAVIHAANEILRDAYDRVQSADELAALAERKMRQIAESGDDGEDPAPLPELVRQALSDLDERCAGRVPAGLDTGLSELDATLGGMRAGQLIVLGARPGAGKTALALALLAHVCRRSRVPGYLASLEMPRGEIVNRLLAMATGVNLHKITRGRVSAEDAERLAGATAPEVYGETPLYVDDRAHSTSGRLHAQVRRMHRRHGVRFAAVDYLQLLTPIDSREGRVQQVGGMARDCKLIARDLEIPVLLLSQLNRQSEARGDGKPKLSDLRESGEIEQHADAVILLHVQPGQSDAQDCWQVSALVAKNRNGPVGEVPLVYRRSCVRFENAAGTWDRRAA
jgi:replicative DNA helicase